MDWREALIENHEKQIALLENAIELMETGIMATGNYGETRETTAESIAWYRRLVSDLQSVVLKIKAGEFGVPGKAKSQN